MVDSTVMQSGRYKAYPEYKDSGVEWLGEIPPHWEISKLRYMFDFGSGLNITKANLQDTGIPCISYGEVHSKFGFEVDTERHDLKFVDEKYLVRNPSALLNKGDLVFADTSEDIEGSGNFTQLVSDKPAFAGYHTVIARPKNDDCSRFYAYLMDSKEIRTQIRHIVKGVKVFTISQSILKGVNIWLPSLRERQSIANFLDYETTKIDTLIEKQQRLIELLSEKRQAVISHAVTKGLNPDVPMKESGVEWLGEVPEHWDVKPLKYLVSEPLQYGANEAAVDTDPTQPRFVRITDVLPNGDLKTDTFRSLPYEVAKPYMLTDGDVLLARSGGTVGKSFIYRDSWGRCCFAGYLIKARINEKLIPAEWFYLNTLTDFYWNWIESIQIQATIQNVSADKYNTFFIALPPIKEAEKIIAYIKSKLDTLDALILKAKQAIQLMQERRTALISAAVTGKIDVRDWEIPVVSEVYC